MACAASLARLKTDYMDLYLLHWRGGVRRLDVVVDTFEALRAEGRIRRWGVSNFGVRDMDELFRVDGGRACATNQVLAWSLLCVIAIFLAYYVLRPIRDELGVAGGVDNLPWLFTGTLLTLLTASPLFAYTVRRFPRERFISISYRFFSANLAGRRSHHPEKIYKKPGYKM